MTAGTAVYAGMTLVLPPAEQNAQCLARCFAVGASEGEYLPASSRMTTLQISCAKSAYPGLALAINGHSAFSATAAMASQVAMRRVVLVSGMARI